MSFREGVSYVRSQWLLLPSRLSPPLSVLCQGAAGNLHNSAGRGLQEVARRSLVHSALRGDTLTHTSLCLGCSDSRQKTGLEFQVCFLAIFNFFYINISFLQSSDTDLKRLTSMLTCRAVPAGCCVVQSLLRPSAAGSVPLEATL